MPITSVVVRPDPPVDGLCMDCKKNKQRYIRKNRYLCKHCCNRDENPSLANLTDEQLDEMLREQQSTQRVKVQLINANSTVGFK